MHFIKWVIYEHFAMQLFVCREVDGQKISKFFYHGYLEYHSVLEDLTKLLHVKVLPKH
jgi:hypothetical protein